MLCCCLTPNQDWELKFIQFVFIARFAYLRLLLQLKRKIGLLSKKRWEKLWMRNFSFFVLFQYKEGEKKFFNPSVKREELWKFSIIREKSELMTNGKMRNAENNCKISISLRIFCLWWENEKKIWKNFFCFWFHPSENIQGNENLLNFWPHVVGELAGES